MANKSVQNVPFQIQTRWERAAVSVGEGETHLVVTIETPKVKRGPERLPVDVALVIDRSGSMTGQPFELARKGLSDALDLLHDSDSFSVTAYDHEVMDVCAQIPATLSNRREVQRTLEALDTRGSTDLFDGWERGTRQLRPRRNDSGERGRIQRTILLTDGLANVGVIDPGEICRAVTRIRQERITTSTLGLGTGVDETLLSGMAEAGGGNFSFVEHARDLPGFFARELGEALTIIAMDAVLDLTLPNGVRARLLNPFPTERVGKNLSITLGDLPAGMTLNLVFAITTRAEHEGPYPPLELNAGWFPATIESRSTEDRASLSVPIDTLMVIGPDDFAAMPKDQRASEAVAEIVAAEAKRAAICQYRSGDTCSARSILSRAHSYIAASPAARMGLLSEIDQMAEFDPASPNFAVQQRQIVNDEHRRSRGREL